jgi:hypothetical protein
VAFGSWRISLVEHSRSSFCSCCFYLSVCRWGSSSFRWRRRGMTMGDPDWWGLGFLLGPVGVNRPRRLLSSRAKSVCLSWETNASAKILIILWSTFWALSFVNSNTCHLIYNNFNLNFIFGNVCLCVCVCAFSLRWESSDMILGDKPLISEVVLLQAQCSDHCWEWGDGFVEAIEADLATGSVHVSYRGRARV